MKLTLMGPGLFTAELLKLTGPVCGLIAVMMLSVCNRQVMVLIYLLAGTHCSLWKFEGCLDAISCM